MDTRSTSSSSSSSSSFFLFLLLLCGFVTESTSKICKPSCTGEVTGAKIPDPLSCNRFYYCQGDGMPSDAPVRCPDQTPVFDADRQSCVMSTTCNVQCLKPCQVSCTASLDIIGNTQDCGTYFLCIPGGVEGPYNCSSDKPFFDGVSCVSDPEMCCDAEDKCVAMCPKEGVEIIDPRDCRKFYVCVGPGEALAENHFECPNGSVFDVYWGRCSSEAVCHTMCYD